MIRRMVDEPALPPTLDELKAELNAVRKRGLGNLRAPGLACLEHSTRLAGLSVTTPAQPSEIEELIRQAVARMGGGTEQRATEMLLGLASNFRLSVLQERTRAAASHIGVGISTFVRHNEKRLLEQVAEGVLAICLDAQSATERDAEQCDRAVWDQQTSASDRGDGGGTSTNGDPSMAAPKSVRLVFLRRRAPATGIVLVCSFAVMAAVALHGNSTTTTTTTTTNNYNYAAPKVKASTLTGSAQQNPYKGGWGPERPLFKLNIPSTYPVFNSITDNPVWGDERNFVSIKKENDPNSAFVDRVKAMPGQSFTMVIYYENSAAGNFGDNLSGWIQGARLKLGAAAYSGSNQWAVWATLSADNCISVYDGASLYSTVPITVSFDPTSIRLYTNYFTKQKGGAVLDPAALTNRGALIGYDKLDGNVAPEYAQAGYIFVNVLVGAA